MPEVRAVLFDYGLVLTGPPDPASWERMKQLLGMAEDDFHAAYWRPRHDYDRGALTGAAYWAAVAGRALDAEEEGKLLQADTRLWTQPNQPMIEWAARLQSAGVPTGILSNLGDAMEDGVRAECPWIDHFPHHTFSHRLRLAKPEAAIYAHAASGLGCAPQHILFIDDREDNIAGAAAAGMQTIRYTGHEAFLQEMRARNLKAALLLGGSATNPVGNLSGARAGTV